jgi:upstream activation factor subunit UAF30
MSTKQKKSTIKSESVVKKSEATVKKPEVAVKKPRASKKKVVEEEVLIDVVEEQLVEVDEVTPPAKGVVNKESVMAEFDAMIKSNEEEIEKLRGADGKVKGVQFLRSLNSNLKKLQKHVSKIAKGKTKRKTTCTTSGFLKPVDISPEMRKFANWDADELHSRIDVTRFICKYVKDNDLQFPEDRRQIVPDAKLKKLFNITKGGDCKMPYYQIQTDIKHHFPKKEATVSK